ncbi:hypothetical protein EK21DRAFT_85879 [Setomelanomma holmii]|uniref:Uncharacterized protein n=1 Tax=Setomelanomma holmii TaxID=210430 RepID=A0A9P4HGE0_9PLEO|nr:hypothetical protein EK21DRAFT_85879 [Setomelanomma holmii]
MNDATGEPPRKKLRRAAQDGPDLMLKPILVRVGKENQDFYIHETIDCLIEAFHDTGYYPVRTPGNIWQYSSSGSAHRKFAINCVVYYYNKKHIYKLVDTEDPVYQPDFPRQILLEILPRLEDGIPFRTQLEFLDLDSTCKYHDHGPDKPCYKTKPAFRI